MNFAHEARHVLFTGMTGKGKSTLVRSLVQKDRARWKFAFETYKREFPRFLGWPLCIDEPGLKRAVHAGKPSAFYSAPLFPGDRIEGFCFWIRWVYEVGKVLPGRKLVIIEEVEKTSAHRNSTLAPAFSEMNDEGRAMEFDIYMIAQRLSTVNELVRAQVTEICTFQHVDTNQLDWLGNEGFDTDAVQKLQRGEWIWRDRETQTTRTNAKHRQKTVAPGKASHTAPPERRETIVHRGGSGDQPSGS